MSRVQRGSTMPTQWVWVAGPLFLGLFSAVWVAGGGIKALELASGWLVEILVGMFFLRRRERIGESREEPGGDARALPIYRGAMWLKTQVLCLAASLSALAVYHIVRGLEYPVEETSITEWFVGAGPILATYFLLAEGSLLLFSILLYRLRGWSLSGAPVKVLTGVAVGFAAVVWPLLAVQLMAHQGIEKLDVNFLALGGLGSGACVVSFFTREMTRVHPGQRTG